MLHGARHKKGGFSLIELLVSMTLMGLLTLALHFGFRVGTNAWAKGDGELQRYRATQAAYEMLSRQLGSALPYYSQQKVNDVPVEVLLFQGAPAGMRFVSNFSCQLRSAAGLRLVEYFVTDSQEMRGKALVVNERRLPDDLGLSQSVFGEITQSEDNTVLVGFLGFTARRDSLYLIDGVDAMRFAYFPRPQPKDEGNGAAMSITGGKKELLPLGAEIKLHWDESRILSAKDFSIVVPFNGAGL